MYHPGKIVEVLKPADKEVEAADASVQAVLQMWDENVLTMQVAKKLAPKIKEGQMVLVDYRPKKDHHQPVPMHEIVKILSGKKAVKVWNAYKEMHERRKRKAASSSQNVAQSYIG